jgi:hypothetical protein
MINRDQPRRLRHREEIDQPRSQTDSTRMVDNSVKLRKTTGNAQGLMAAGTSKLAHLLNRLEKFYGKPKPQHPTDPYEMILYINSAYPATDASCAKVFDALKRSVGLRIDDILAAPKGKLTEIMKLGGIFPEQRVVRLEIAALVKILSQATRELRLKAAAGSEKR